MAVGGWPTQIHALQHTVGRSKCAVMQERIAAINPSCRVRVIEDFLTADSAERILSHGCVGVNGVTRERPTQSCNATDVHPEPGS